MTNREWFPVADAWESLGHVNPEALRHWIRTGIREGWLKPGKHVKPKFPNRKKSAWLVHVAKCQAVDTTKVKARKEA